MASFNNFQLLNDYLVLNYISCFQQNINTVRRKHIISIERTKIYSVPWMVVGLILSIYGLSVNISLLISGIVILVYQAISMFITVILIRVPGYTYSSRYCGSSDLQTPVPTTTTFDHHLPMTKAPIIFESKTTGQDETIHLRDLIDHAHTFETIVETIGIDQFKRLKMVIEHDRQLRDSQRVYLLPDDKTPQKPRSEEQEVSLFARRLQLLSEKMIRKYAKASV
jgi:hypothetical protein